MKCLNVKRMLGLNLIELMIIIAILGILASVALPAYNTYMSKAKFNETVALIDYKFSDSQLEYITPVPIVEGVSVSSVYASYDVASTYFFYDLESSSHISPPKPSWEVDEIFERLPVAKAYFGVPPTINIDSKTQIYLALSFDEIENAQKLITNLVDKDPEEIKVAPRTEVTLKSADFEIVKVSPSIQAVRKNSFTKWIWSITPKESGVRQLNFSVFALVDVEGKETPLELNTYKRSINVTITTAQKWSRLAEKHSAWILGILAAFFTTIFTLYKVIKYINNKVEHN